MRGGAAAKNPDGFAGWIVLAGIDVDDQLRLRRRRHSREGNGDNRDCRFSSRFIQFHFRRVLFYRYFRHRVSLLPNIHPQLFLIQWNLFSMMVVITTATTTVTAIQNNANIV